MSSRMLIIIFVDLISGLAPFLVFLRLQQDLKSMEGGQRKQAFRYLSYFVGLYGILRILAAARGFFVFLGRQKDLGMMVWNWGTGPLTYLHLVPLAFFYGISFFPEKKNLKFLYTGLITVFITATLFTHFWYPSTPGEITDWGTRPKPYPLTKEMFSYLIFIPFTLSCLIDFFRRLNNWKQKKDPKEKQLFDINFGVLIYAVTGVFDALAIAEGWAFLLVRIGVMTSALVFYLAITSKPEE